MKRTVMTAVLIAAFAMPALAEDLIIRKDDPATAARIDRTTTASTKNQSEMAPTVIRDMRDGGCMHHDSSAMNMM